MSAAAFNDDVLAAIRAGAIVSFSLSGGKDSTVAAHAATQLLDEMGHPKERRVAIHADLGRAEWKSTPGMVEAVAKRLDVPLMVVRHRRHDMVSRWEARFEEGKRRYANLEVFNLIGPWSSSSLRFCTAELKQQVISPALIRRWPGELIVSVVGIRREESPGRRLAPVSKWEDRWARANGGRMLTWHPVLDLKIDEVFEQHRTHSLPLHEAYPVYGSSRVSCVYCVLQREADQKASSRDPRNHDLYRHLVGMEMRSTFSFQPTRWLADVSPELLAAVDRIGVIEAKVRAAERRKLEAELPADLRYVKGWPLRAPTPSEAELVAQTRAVILAHHDLENLYPTADAVIGRFEALLEAKRLKGAA